MDCRGFLAKIGRNFAGRALSFVVVSAIETDGFHQGADVFNVIAEDFQDFGITDSAGGQVDALVLIANT